MTGSAAALSPEKQTFAFQVLDLHPDPAFFCLPLYDAAQTGTNIVDFSVVYSNKNAQFLFQLSEGKLLSSHYPGGDTALSVTGFDQFLEAVQQGKKVEQNFTHQQRNRYYHLQASCMQEGVLVFIRDITDRVMMERQAEAQQRMVDAAGSGLLVLEPLRKEDGEINDFLLLQANAAVSRLLELAENPVGKMYRRLLPEPPEMFRLKCRVLQKREPITYLYHYTESGASGKWFQVALSPLEQNRLLVSLTDVTDIKLQQEVQQQQHDIRIKAIFDSAHAGMYTLTPVRDAQGTIYDFRLSLVNQSVASYLGLQAQDLIGSLGSVYFPAYKTNGLFDRYVKTMETGEPSTFDLHYDDGYDNYFTINVVKIGDEIFASFTDHSPLKRLQRELEASIADLKRSNRSLEQFAHAASHDLQEPLRKITNYTSKLQDEHAENLSDAAYGYVERIQTASKRMQRLIKDLLVFAEVGTNQGDMEEISLDQILADVVNDLEIAITEKDAVIRFENLGTIRGNSLHLQQMFQNLLSNSIKYSRQGVPPCVTITCTPKSGKDAGFVLAEYAAGQDYCLLEIKDNGQGFNQEQAGQIFKIFQRLPQHRLEYTGTGIGLAIVQRVVENHRGYIRAAGVPGQGATFSILLPA